MKIRLPTGGALVAPADPTRDAPGDCSRAFSLLPLIASYLATTECLMKVLELVGPLVTIVTRLDRTADIVPFVRAANQLAPCEFAATSGGMLGFLQDVICVLIQALNCAIEQSSSVVDVLTSLTAQLQSARATGNAELIDALEREQKSVQTRLTGLFDSVDSVAVVLDMSAPLIASSGFDVPGLPAAPDAADPNAAALWISSLRTRQASLQTIADNLGGCGK